ncbi:MAG TPA: hypothetical protein VK923_16730 [Euzebyales bacterium]|nr:hypothetical protein [Euzebyales bacterium]
MAVTPHEVGVAVAAGADAWEPVQDLRGVPGVRLAASPRHATVLLIAGTVSDADREALHRVHDQLPRPRAVVAWRPAEAAAEVPAQTVAGDVAALVDALHEAQAAVLATPERGADDLLPDTEPNEWRGVGPFGQGGEGMMGGAPYGRPMAMTGDDRDGLALDQLNLTLGPFLDPLPGGCRLKVTLQGDVLREVELTIAAAHNSRFPQPDRRDLRTARHLLRRTAHGLHVAGLDALAARTAALAGRVADTADRTALVRDARRLERRIRRSGLLWTHRGVGAMDGVDAADRWRARLASLVSALDGTVVTPAAPEDQATIETVLTGMTLGDAMATLASVDVRAQQPAAAVAS